MSKRPSKEWVWHEGDGNVRRDTEGVSQKQPRRHVAATKQQSCQLTRVACSPPRVINTSFLPPRYKYFNNKLHPGMRKRRAAGLWLVLVKPTSQLQSTWRQTPSLYYMCIFGPQWCASILIIKGLKLNFWLFFFRLIRLRGHFCFIPFTFSHHWLHIRLWDKQIEVLLTFQLF